jgi:glycosyltransferase involved in cell wall biosynthesis
MRFLFLESFFGGSHRDFAEGLVSHSRHKIDLLTLPARFWKWRMRGAALHFLKKLPPLQNYQGVIATDLMSFSDFKAMTVPSCPAALVYFHENQLTYPLAPGETIDYQYGFTDITTALAADRVRFNSKTHFDAFFSQLAGFLKMMPEYRPGWVQKAIRSKAGVLYPGCLFPGEDQPLMPLHTHGSESAPLVIWNHRWEFDKNPQGFFDALDEVLKQGMEFRIALLGENFQTVPKSFLAARERYGERIVRYGYEPSKSRYVDWLRQGAIVISTATQENFGISVVEAIRFGCLPLLPRRLVYPEIIPKAFHSDFLYHTPQELVEKVTFILGNLPRFQEKRKALSHAMGAYAWERTIDRYDSLLEELARLGPGENPRRPQPLK